MISGIYTITNNITKKLYVGCAADIISRFKNHKSLLLKGKHQNQHLQNAFNKYGMNSFTFEVLEECSIDVIWALEHYWCNMLNSRDRDFGYNIAITNPYKQSGISDETRYKMSQSAKGKIVKQSTKDKMSIIMSGRKNPHVKSEKGRIANRDKRRMCSSIAKLSLSQVKDIKILIETGIPMSKIAVTYNVSHSTINSIKRGDTWKDVKIL